MNLNIQSQTNKSTSRQIEERFLDNPIEFMESKLAPYRAILNALLIIDNNKKTGEAYIDELCALSGYKRSCVKKYINILIREGFIGKVGRYHTSSLFRVNPILHLPHMRTLLSPYFKALCFLPLLFLSSTFVRSYSVQPLQVNNLYIKNNINNSIENIRHQLSVPQSNFAQTLMNTIKQFTNMSKRSESDNNSPKKNPWNVPQRKPVEPRRYQERSDTTPLGSIESDHTRARKIREQEEQRQRMFENELRKENQPTPEQLWDIINKAGAKFMK